MKGLFVILGLLCCLHSVAFSPNSGKNPAKSINTMASADTTSSGSQPPLVKIRTITAFVSLAENDPKVVHPKLEATISKIKEVETLLSQNGYEVQTMRIATNSFEDWLWKVDDSSTESIEKALDFLKGLDDLLQEHSIDFMALGPAKHPKTVQTIVPRIIQSSPRLSLSANMKGHMDLEMAQACAACVHEIAQIQSPEYMEDGLGNFRFGVAACCDKTPIPFFPVARAPPDSPTQFAIGLENGRLAQHLLSQCNSIHDIATTFRDGMQTAVEPIQTLCESFSTLDFTYCGMDTSLNPSLDEDGSVAAALELVPELAYLGGPGSLAVANAVTKALQSIPQRTGYCGLMLPLCEDARLAALANQGAMKVTNLLSISAVCGVGVDTVPLPGDVDPNLLTALYLDVAALAHRYDKPLSCRIFPAPGKQAGDYTTFDSPHMINAKALSLDIDG